MWVVLLSLVVLIILSAAGAFLGAYRTRRLVNSTPLVVYWFLVSAQLLSGFFLFKRLVRSPGLFSVHLGVLLVLVGSMFGSEAGHELARKILGEAKIPSGYMSLYIGESSNVVRDAELRREIGRLPFTLRLRDFWIEHYVPWLLIVEAPPVLKDGKVQAQDYKRIEWAVGRESPVPYTAARLRVLQYLPSARPVYAEGGKPRSAAK